MDVVQEVPHRARDRDASVPASIEPLPPAAELHNPRAGRRIPEQAAGDVPLRPRADYQRNLGSGGSRRLRRGLDHELLWIAAPNSDEDLRWLRLRLQYQNRRARRERLAFVHTQSFGTTGGSLSVTFARLAYDAGMRLAPELRPLQPADIPALRRIERASFDERWPPTAFERELRENRLARYIVASLGPTPAGFAGLWLVLDEGHVVTLAVGPQWRRRGFGRLLLHGLAVVAQAHGIEVLTLEVRPSNEAARRLYRLYGFHEVGRRPRYYADGEDALILTTESISSPPFIDRLARRLAELEERLPGAAAALRELERSYS